MVLISQFPSPDCSGKLFKITDYFLLGEKSDQRKLFLFLQKKEGMKKRVAESGNSF